MLQAMFGTYLYWKDIRCSSEIQIELGIPYFIWQLFKRGCNHFALLREQLLRMFGPFWKNRTREVFLFYKREAIEIDAMQDSGALALESKGHEGIPQPPEMPADQVLPLLWAGDSVVENGSWTLE